MPSLATTGCRIGEALLTRNAISRAFFDREADRLARVSRDMAVRFRRGGRLLAFGTGSGITNAQHVAVEFTHPVIVGKRALPALDLSPSFEPWLEAILRPDDIVMGFPAHEDDDAVARALRAARAAGALTLALPGNVPTPSDDPFVTQEIIEIVYHTIWETVHVFLEHAGSGHDTGSAAFLYPFLGAGMTDTNTLVPHVALSMIEKAMDDERLRASVAQDQASAMGAAATAMRERIDAGGTLIFFGNGGSATDANDWARDCVAPVKPGMRRIPAISLSSDAATISAIANDIGPEAIFLRQMIAQARPINVAVALSTSGGSANIIAALGAARAGGLLTVALLGYDGGEIRRQGLADCALVVPCDYIPRIQEVQASIYHVLCNELG